MQTLNAQFLRAHDNADNYAQLMPLCAQAYIKAVHDSFLVACTHKQPQTTLNQLACSMMTTRAATDLAILASEEYKLLTTHLYTMSFALLDLLTHRCRCTYMYQQTANT